MTTQIAADDGTYERQLQRHAADPGQDIEEMHRKAAVEKKRTTRRNYFSSDREAM